MKQPGFRRKLLATAISAIITLPVGMASAKLKVEKGGDYIPANRFSFTVSANQGDDYTVEILTESGRLVVKGYTLENKVSSGEAVIRYGTATTNYSIWLDDGVLYSGEIVGGSNIHGILLDNGSPSVVSMNMGVTTLNGKISAGAGKNALHFKEELGGKITVGAKGALIGDHAIKSEGGRFAEGAEIIVKGTLTSNLEGVNKKAIDVSDSTTGLKLTVDGGFIEGHIVGSSASTDNLSASGNAVFEGDVSGFETISFNGTDKNNSLEFTGDIASANSHAVAMTGKGNVFFAKTASQSLDGSLSFDGDSKVKVKVDSSLSSAALAVSGNINLNNHDVKFIPVPTKNDFDDDQSSTVVLVSAANDFNVDGTGTIVADSPFSDNKEVNNGNNGDIGVIVNPRTPDEVKESVKQSGGGNNAANAAEQLVKALQESGTEEQYEDLASQSQSDFNDVVEDGNANNAGTTQNANTNLASKSKNNVVRRLDNLRLNEIADGKAYGDGMDGQSFWVQAMGSDIKLDERTNSDNDTFSGYDAEMSGFTMGWDKNISEDFRGGAAFTLANMEVDKHNSNDNSSIRNYQVSFYGSWDLGSWYLDGVLNLGQSKHNRTRYPSGTEITAEFDSNIYGVQLMTGTELKWDGLAVEPLIGFNYTMVKTDAYEETSATASIHRQTVDDQKYQKIELGLGVEFSKTIQMDKAELIPSLRLMAWHDFKGQQVETTTRFVAGGDSFILKGADPVKKSYQGTAALNYKRNDNMSFSVGYEFNKKSDFRAHSMFMKMKYDF
ncbi:autotransporter outer membrane beta-barrel domain-containing protein [Endozoicomonas sp. OPT23]|uniref:autotransporter family protein n=1 Tax=Endozoicomonas sp. OPT23 TaxID=2072845 RepID=UPI001891AFD1|nr:autotransporter outer membrane beta-barrel domain-containing protein [Endozoicomonas sp. OPT23]